LTVCILFGPVVSLAALDAYPKTTIAENIAATWSQYCPAAHAGLDIVHGVFDSSEFISARYYSSSNGGWHATPETDARIGSFYGVSAYPTVIFNGKLRVPGAGALTASTGQPYLDIVESANLTMSPIRIDIDSFDASTGDIQVTVTMFSSTHSLNNDYLFFVLTEDNVSGPGPETHHHVTRDIIEERISLSGPPGNSIVVNQSFVVDPGWNVDELHAAVFVQREDPMDLEILQAACTYPQPEYKVRAMVPFPRVRIGPSTATSVGKDFTVKNVGLAETFSINLIIDEGPPGWTVSYVDEFGGTHQGEWSFPLGLEESTEFHVELTPNSPGFMKYHFELNSPNLVSPLVIPFTFFTDDLSCILVDDDGGYDYENYFIEALNAAGESFGVWDLGKSKLTAEVADSLSLLIWNAGLGYPTLDEVDRDFLMNFLDRGGRLFLSGQDIGWDLHDQGGAAVTFLNEYLHATYIRDDTNLMYLDGVSGDPISDGMVLHIADGDGANNQAYPSEIEARDADATEFLRYQGDGCGAIRVIDGVSAARVVYTAFGFEGIDNAQDRHDLLIRSLDWLQILLEDGFETGDTSAWSATVP
jgi:hypothetical protein